MIYDILETLAWMLVATLGIVISFYGLYLVAVEDPWDMVLSLIHISEPTRPY